MTGYTLEECLKIDIFKFLTPESGMKVKQILEEELIFEQKGAPPGRIRIIEVTAYHKNGSIIWLELLPSFLRDEKGKPIGIVVVARDISDRKKTERLTAGHINELELLLKISTALRKANNIDEILPIFIDETLRLFNSEAGLVLLYNPKR